MYSSVGPGGSQLLAAPAASELLQLWGRVSLWEQALRRLIDVRETKANKGVVCGQISVEQQLASVFGTKQTNAISPRQ